MILIKVEIAHIRAELPCENGKLEQLAGHENDTGRQQSRQELTHHQHVASNRRQKIKMQTLVKNLAAKQVHENSQAAEKNRKPQIEKLKHPGVNHCVLGQVVSLVNIDAGNFSIREADIQNVRSVGIRIVLVRNLDKGRPRGAQQRALALRRQSSGQNNHIAIFRQRQALHSLSVVESESVAIQVRLLVVPLAVA